MLFHCTSQCRPVKYPVGQGMTLYAWQTDRFKVGMLSLSMAKQTDVDRSPATSLLFSTLKRGTERYPSLGRINERLDELYASSLVTRNSRCADRQVVGFATEFLDNRYLDDPQAECIADGCVEMMAQMLMYPLTDGDGLLLPRFVDSEKNNLCDAIRAQQNNPRLWAALRLNAIMCEGEPCGIPLHGSVDRIMAIPRERLREVHEEWLRESEIVFFYVGPMDPKRVVAMLQQHFEAFSPKVMPLSCPTTVIRRAAGVREVTEEMAVSQGKLNLGFRTGITVKDEGYYAMAVANEIFGASPVSKLFTEVREKQSLCYSIGSSYDLYKGLMKVSCGIDPDARDIACEAILHQWDHMRAGNFTDEEIDAAKRSLDNSYRTVEDNPHAVEGFYYGRLLEDVDMSVEDCRRGLMAVTREQIVRAACEASLDTVYFLRGTCPDMEEGDEDE